MDSVDYRQKYIKYKQKYIELKKNIMRGGGDNRFLIGGSVVKQIPVQITINLQKEGDSKNIEVSISKIPISLIKKQVVNNGDTTDYIYYIPDINGGQSLPDDHEIDATSNLFIKEDEVDPGNIKRFIPDEVTFWENDKVNLKDQPVKLRRFPGLNRYSAIVNNKKLKNLKLARVLDFTEGSVTFKSVLMNQSGNSFDYEFEFIYKIRDTHVIDKHTHKIKTYKYNMSISDFLNITHIEM